MATREGETSAIRERTDPVIVETWIPAQTFKQSLPKDLHVIVLEHIKSDGSSCVEVRSFHKVSSLSSSETAKMCGRGCQMQFDHLTGTAFEAYRPH